MIEYEYVEYKTLSFYRDKAVVDELKEIRKEITNLVKTYPFIDHMDSYVKETDVLEIIDKHIKQIEGLSE